MESKELDLRADAGKQLMDLGARSVDLNLIYNAHGTPEDALLSVQQVLPNSVVFLEGYTTRPDGLANFEHELTLLNGLQLQTGKEHEEYKLLKTAIQESIKDFSADYEPTTFADFTLCNLMAIQALLEKDCLIYYADYKPVKSATIDADEIKAHNQFFKTMHNILEK